MNVLILSNSSFPWGMAATTRVRCLAKGMLAEGIHLEHIGLHGADVKFTEDKKAMGVIDGISYSYPGRFPVRPNTWFMRRVDDITSTAGILIKIVTMRVRNELDAVLIYSRDHRTVLLWSRLLCAMKTPVILELCEWPLAIAETNKTGLKNAELFCHNAVLSVDAIIPISTYIDTEVALIARSKGKHIPSFKIPILIDAEPSHGGSQKDAAQDATQYLLYAGSIAYFDIAKFIVDISVKLQAMGVRIKVKFTGGGDDAAFEKLRDYARGNHVLQNLEFTGFVSQQELDELMSGALALLAPLPDNLQSIARFPTKLGYYLSSARPVITNDVGDISEYLKDNTNAYIAHAYDASLFAEKVCVILNSPENATSIGSKGMEMAFEKFHYSNACKGIRAFLESLRRQVAIKERG